MAWTGWRRPGAMGRVGVAIRVAERIARFRNRYASRTSVRNDSGVARRGDSGLEWRDGPRARRPIRGSVRGRGPGFGLRHTRGVTCKGPAHAVAQRSGEGNGSFDARYAEGLLDDSDHSRR